MPGGGPFQFDVIGSSNVKLNSGTYLAATAEKPIGLLPLYVDAQVNWLHSSGSVNYNYYSPTELTYTATNVNATVDVYNVNLGLKAKILEVTMFRPYVEAGGIAGYTQFAYDKSLQTPAVLAVGSDYKMVDGALDFGFFAEAGVEASLTPGISVVVAYKYMDMTTQQMSTDNNQYIHFISNAYYGGFAFRY